MSASEYCKAHGIKSVKELALLTGLKRNRLFLWYKTERKAFEVLVDGVNVRKSYVDYAAFCEKRERLRKIDEDWPA